VGAGGMCGILAVGRAERISFLLHPTETPDPVAR
jgi:hypothetical protein